jgi:hypothetical protein
MRLLGRVCPGGVAAICLSLALSAGISHAQIVSASGPPPTWKRLSPAVSPSARAAHVMAYDPVSGNVVIFGGYDDANYLDETWTFEGSTWTRQTPPISPSPRAEASLAYDAILQRLVLFGGYDSTGCLGDTWLWDGATSTWTNVLTAIAPPAITGPMSFEDPLSGRAVIFGGYDGHIYQNGTWIFQGNGWKQLTPQTVPGARAAAVAALDPSTNLVVMFGGLGHVNRYNTWTWDGTDWSLQFPAVQPPLVYDARAAYSPQLGGLTLFGGGENGADLNDTWFWTGSDWTLMQTARSPSAREAFGMVYDDTLGLVVLFGGQNGNSLFGDTWELLRRR